MKLVEGEALVRKNPPPGPHNYLAWCGLTWRHYAHFTINAPQYAAKLAETYGDVCGFRLFTQRGYLIRRPELIHEVLVRQKDRFAKAEWQLRILRTVLGDGLLTTEGELWRDDRRTIQGALRHDSMGGYAQIAARATERMLATWSDPSRIDLAEATNALSMAIAIESTLGVPPSDEASQLADAVRTGSDLLNRQMESPLQIPGWMRPGRTARLTSAIDAIHRFVERVIESRRAVREPRGDLVSMLLQVAENHPDPEVARRMVRDHAVTMLIAGNHSVSAALAWFWVLALREPGVYDRLRSETRAVLRGRMPEAADIPRLDLLRQVLQESLRLFPAAWVLFIREAKERTELGGYTIERGGWVFISPWVTQRDPGLFPDPLRFDPGRFAPERLGLIPKGAYFPFGHGPHACIGERLAMTQMIMAIATMLVRCDFTADPAGLRLDLARDMAIRPRWGCPVGVKQRAAVRLGKLSEAVPPSNA